MSIDATLTIPIAQPQALLRALRSDHAGETGAVAIYQGILAVSSNADVRNFASRHLASERQHLELMNQVLAPEARSSLLPLWRVAGYLTGLLPALVGPAAVYRTIEAVETFVDAHYSSQIRYLRHRYPDTRLLQLLEACRADEVAHREDARARIGAPGVIGRLWTALVGAGSKIGVFFASRI
jgi:ubiquinone biosynthesis monooxygenase Coq7